MFCSFGKPYHVWCVHAYLACSGACNHRPVSCLRTSLVQYLKIANEKKALMNVAEIGVIETEETPSRKGKKRKGKATKSIVRKCMQVKKASVSREKRHESFASFAVTWSIFDHQFMNDIIVVSFLLYSPYPAPGLPASSIFPFSILL